MIHPQCQLS
ncbi:Protein of unknown function [Leuconostoc citreum]|nr:Protein of unknown function [Leuconostoc citreum LBAE C10]CCF26066.1 Protein of unknown function [Leuconostoc citreum LBAE C11]CDX65392.1 Protein of unknown function [Leuconostoc citreum]CDX67163.1 Protein of unknown function [Leuconostoc citreum]